MAYNLEYQIEQDKSHILPNILSGAREGIISQFLADILITLLSNENSLVIDDIQISEVPAYYASVASGMMAGFLTIYLDPFAVVAFTSVTYAYIFALMDYIINGVEFEFIADDIVFDILVTEILLFLFDPTAINQYLRYDEKRHHIEPIHKRQDRSVGLTLFFIVLTNSITFLVDELDGDTEEV